MCVGPCVGALFRFGSFVFCAVYGSVGRNATHQLQMTAVALADKMLQQLQFRPFCARLLSSHAGALDPAGVIMPDRK